ncbi:MAG: hypothetical protein U0931_28640 [Vulcanimicrobiota bacterium]
MRKDTLRITVTHAGARQSARKSWPRPQELLDGNGGLNDALWDYC